MDSEWAHPTDEAAPGFAGATLVPACSQPDESFLFLAGDTAQSISRQRWEDLAPGMGLADVITAHTTFDQLANEGEGEGKEEEDDDCTISEAVFKKYCGRIHNKARPGETRVGGVETNFGAGCSADEMLAKHLSAGEKVLIAGGVPSYLVQDMTKTPRTSGTLILTTHALYWRQHFATTRKHGEVKCHKFGVAGAWCVEPCRAGPFGLGVTDTCLKLHLTGTGTQTLLRFNFPMNTEIRDTWVAGLKEVLAAHAFCVDQLAQPLGVVPPAVSSSLQVSVFTPYFSFTSRGPSSPRMCASPCYLSLSLSRARAHTHITAHTHTQRTQTGRYGEAACSPEALQPQPHQPLRSALHLSGHRALRLLLAIQCRRYLLCRPFPQASASTCFTALAARQGIYRRGHATRSPQNGRWWG